MSILPAANDHDLLLRVDTKLDSLITAFTKLEVTVQSKADAERVSKLETEVSALKAKAMAIGGGLAVLEFAIQVGMRFLH